MSAVFTTALATAMLAALAQLAYQGFNVATARRFIFASRDVIWMAPVSYGVFFAVVALGLACAALLFPRLVRPPVVGFVFAFLAVFVLLLPFSALAIWAISALAVGVGVQVATLAHRREGHWGRVMLRTAARAGGALALILVIVESWEYASQRRAVAALPPADGGGPNVLLIVLDATGASRMSAYGYLRTTTPTISRMASEGVIFERAYATAPWTLPSHATMLTGSYPTTLSTDFRHRLDKAEPTLAERLGRRGYVSGGFVANEYYTTWETGLARGFNHWADFQRSWEQTLLSAWPWQTAKMMDLRSAKSWQDVKMAIRYASFRMHEALEFDPKHSDQVRREFLDWQSKVPADRPFFAVLNMFDAHRPRYSAPEFHTRFTPTPRGPDTYDNAVAYMDSEVGRILAELESRGVLDRTAVFVTADHGELLGEHGLFGHSNNVYRETLWVPLVLRYPRGVAGGARVGRAVSLRDLAATVADLAGVPADDSPPGFSLLPLIGSTDTSRQSSPAFSFAHKLINQEPHFPSSRGEIRSLVTDRHHYILHHDGGEEFFNLQTDPLELNNLAASGGGEDGAARERMRRLVDSLSPVGHTRAFPYVPMQPRSASRN